VRLVTGERVSWLEVLGTVAAVVGVAGELYHAYAERKRQREDDARDRRIAELEREVQRLRRRRRRQPQDQAE
jgi:hypothetical protein